MSEDTGQQASAARTREAASGGFGRWLRRLFLYPLGIVVLLGVVLAVNSIWYKPFFIRVFFERVFIELALDDPELMTQVGIFETFGFHAHNGRLTDISLAAQERRRDRLLHTYAMLQSYDEAWLSRENRLSKRVLEHFLETQIALDEFRYHNYPVNQLFGPPSDLPQFLDTYHRVADARDAGYYVDRLRAIPVKFTQLREGLAVREEQGILPPTFIIDKVLQQMRAFAAQPARETILYRSFADKLRGVPQISSAAADAFLADAETAIAEAVLPAYRDLITYFETLRPQTNDDAGVWKFPDGERFYAAMLASQTTTSLTADEIHEIGLAEVERIQGEIVALFAAEGYDTSVGFTALITDLATQDRFFYPDTEAGRDQILEDYQAIVDEADARVGDVFRMRPDVGVEVRRVPEFLERTAPPAYYTPPPVDNTRPGIFYANLYNIRATRKYTMRAYAHHEAVPGHHFQIAIQQDLPGLPTFRRFPLFMAYVEGWGLYAERLGSELGLHPDVYSEIGRLQTELFRAVRLVVDTGLHDRRWTREEAIEYMVDNTGLALSDVIIEIERYIVMPAQATSYKIGLEEILRMRREARESLGDAFDLRDFHDVVLGDGALPLSLLQEQIDAYIADAPSQN